VPFLTDDECDEVVKILFGRAVPIIIQSGRKVAASNSHWVFLKEAGSANLQIRENWWLL
jgi:hypothetical protein